MGKVNNLEAMPTPANDLKQANDYIANDVDKIKKAVGGIYQCDNCGSDYTARTVWQRFCPTCSAERKAGVLKSKAKKANA